MLSLCLARAPAADTRSPQVILNGKVYDVTEFMPDHPGGKKAIMLYAGKDASEEFNMLHGACCVGVACETLGPC